jgi:hypothetical protein
MEAKAKKKISVSAGNHTPFFKSAASYFRHGPITHSLTYTHTHTVLWKRNLNLLVI